MTMQELKIFEEKQIRTIWDEVQEAELMYKLFDLVSGNLEEVNEYLDRMY